MKNNITYFPHECNAYLHSKFKMLRAQYGWEGEAKFWALNGMIGNSEACLLNISKPRIKADVCTDLGMTHKQFGEFIAYLHTDCELIIFIGESISTEQCQETLKEVSKKRQKARDKKSYPQNEQSSGELSESYPQQLKSYPQNEQSWRAKERKGKKERKKEVFLNNSSEATPPEDKAERQKFIDEAKRISGSKRISEPKAIGKIKIPV